MGANTKYQMWITGNAESEKLRLPVLPEKFTVSVGSGNTTVNVAGLGEIVIKQARKAFQFSFSSFFPVTTFPGLVGEPASPLSCVNKIKKWLDSDKPVHLIVTDVGVDAYCTIEKFNYYEQGGDVGTIYYDLTLKEYREVTVRQVNVNDGEAEVDSTETRVDNTEVPDTVTMKEGETTWDIAKEYTGDGRNRDDLAGQKAGTGETLTVPADWKTNRDAKRNAALSSFDPVLAPTAQQEAAEAAAAARAAARRASGATFDESLL